MTENSPIKKTDVSINFEEKLYKKILPKDLVNGRINAQKNNNQTELKNFDSDILSFIKSYLAKINNPRLIEGERCLWSDESKGCITNFRAIKFFKKQDGSVYKIKVPLLLSDTAVANTYRKSSGKSSKYSRTSVNQSISSTYGDLVFLSRGKVVLRFENINDPHGVQRIIRTSKKQSLSV